MGQKRSRCLISYISNALISLQKLRYPSTTRKKKSTTREDIDWGFGREKILTGWTSHQGFWRGGLWPGEAINRTPWIIIPWIIFPSPDHQSAGLGWDLLCSLTVNPSLRIRDYRTSIYTSTRMFRGFRQVAVPVGRQTRLSGRLR